MRVSCPMYHATFRCHLPSILKSGLGAVDMVKSRNYSDSNEGVVCLTNDPYVAESFCEAAETVPDETYESGIAVLEVDCVGLDLELDRNILENASNEESPVFLQYVGEIPPGRISGEHAHVLG